MGVQFIPARYDHVVNIVRRARKTHPECLPDKAIRSLLGRNNREYLLSWGDIIRRGVQPNKDTMDDMTRKLQDIRQMPFTTNIPIVMDSGGYQIQCGLVDDAHIPGFIDLYYGFLNSTLACPNRAFVLDIAPGMGKAFPDTKLLHRLNDQSYSRAAEMSEETRSSLIYIDHFRTRPLLLIWNHLADAGYPMGFEHFATGGMASSSCRSASTILPEAIPLVRMLRQSKADGRTGFKFHVLGTGEPHRLLSYALLNRTIQAHHGMDVTITCDSTYIAKVLPRTRIVPFVDRAARTIFEVDLHSQTLGQAHPFYPDMTQYECFVELTRQKLTPYGIAPFPLSAWLVYNPAKKGNPINNVSDVYASLIYLDYMGDIEDWCEEVANKLYPLYHNQCHAAFIDALVDVFRRMKSNTVLDNTVKRAQNVRLTMDLVAGLSWMHCEFHVHNVLNPVHGTSTRSINTGTLSRRKEVA